MNNLPELGEEKFIKDNRILFVKTNNELSSQEREGTEALATSE